MALKSIISSGSKVDQYVDKPVLKVGAQNTMKLNRKALELINGGKDDFAFIADGTEKNQFYIAIGKEAEIKGFKGSKIGIVGDKNDFNEASFTQLQFNSATLGKMLFPAAAVCLVAEEGETDTDSGLTFHELQIIETRADYNTRLGRGEVSADEAADAEGEGENEPTTEGEEGEGEGEAKSARKSRRSE